MSDGLGGSNAVRQIRTICYFAKCNVWNIQPTLVGGEVYISTLQFIHRKDADGKEEES